MGLDEIRAQYHDCEHCQSCLIQSPASIKRYDCQNPESGETMVGPSWGQKCAVFVMLPETEAMIEKYYSGRPYYSQIDDWREALQWRVSDGEDDVARFKDEQDAKEFYERMVGK